MKMDEEDDKRKEAAIASVAASLNPKLKLSSSVSQARLSKFQVSLFIDSLIWFISYNLSEVSVMFYVINILLLFSSIGTAQEAITNKREIQNQKEIKRSIQYLKSLVDNL